MPTSGRYYTNEYSGELLLPILGEGFNAPGFKAVELSGQYRFVDNSIAGSEDVWGVGLRWEVVDGFTLRASRSRNFRAPTLFQLFAPSSTGLAGGIQDPCDSRFINAGTNPAVRAANCLALFAANPLFGTGSAGTAPVGASAAARLAGFQDTAVNFSTANVTSGGNAKLENEVSDTTTYGFVFQPASVPGPAWTDGRRLHPTRPDQRPDRLHAHELQPGLLRRARRQRRHLRVLHPRRRRQHRHRRQHDVQRGVVEVQGRDDRRDLPLPLGLDHPSRREGNIELATEATHNETLKQTVQGVVTELVDTVGLTGAPEPCWSVRADIRYIRGPLRLTYEAYYLPSALAVPGRT